MYCASNHEHVMHSSMKIRQFCPSWRYHAFHLDVGYDWHDWLILSYYILADSCLYKFTFHFFHYLLSWGSTILCRTKETQSSFRIRDPTPFCHDWIEMIVREKQCWGLSRSFCESGFAASLSRYLSWDSTSPAAAIYCILNRRKERYPLLSMQTCFDKVMNREVHGKFWSSLCLARSWEIGYFDEWKQSSTVCDFWYSSVTYILIQADVIWIFCPADLLMLLILSTKLPIVNIKYQITDNHHRSIELLPADILVHCGDIVGNYWFLWTPAHFYRVLVLGTYLLLKKVPIGWWVIHQFGLEQILTKNDGGFV